MHTRHSWRDAHTGVLVAHGYIDSEMPGLLVQEESDEFALEPLKWMWDGTDWVPQSEPPQSEPPQSKTRHKRKS